MRRTWERRLGAMKKVETKTTVHSQMVRGLTKEISESQGDKLPLVSENGIAVLNRRYLVKDAEGKPVEVPENLYRRVARNIAQGDVEYGSTALESGGAGRAVLPDDGPQPVHAELSDADECRPGIAAAFGVLRAGGAGLDRRNI